MNQVAVKPLISRQAAFEKVLSFMPSRYTPLSALAKQLADRHIISIHKPYLGKHPKHQQHA